MIEASLLPPPTVGQFIAALKAATDRENVGSKNELYAEVGDPGVEVGSRGTKCVRMSSVKAILEFEVVRQDKGLTAATLDDYFELFAKFVVDPAFMSENVDTQRKNSTAKGSHVQTCKCNNAQTEYHNPEDVYL